MNDLELVRNIHEAARALERAMTAAGDAGLLIDFGIKAYSCEADTQRVYKRGDYRATITATRVISPLAG